jgi:regulator of protease activity HflC (stomatin/prohibitin superfamily)
MSAELALLILIAAIVVAVAVRALVSRAVVQEYERGLLYHSGRYVRTLEPGGSWILRPRSRVEHIDMRRRQLAVAGQEVLTADNVGLKLSMAAAYEVADPALATHSVEDYAAALYTAIQLAVRDAVAATEAEALLGRRDAIGTATSEAVAPQAEAIGLTLLSLDVRDVMFPGDLKRVFGEVVRARKEGQAALERARGETAALRNLANAARLVNDHPGLMGLRILQTLAEPAGTLGQTRFVVTLPDGLIG